MTQPELSPDLEIDTARLRLVPYAPEHLIALAESPDRFEELTGNRAADGLREFLLSPEVSSDYLTALRSARATNPWVHGFAAIHRVDRCVIGNGAFKGPPDGNGVVEIAYGIVPGYESHGFATEVAAALVALAWEGGHARLVRAHTLPEANASTRVLSKCGFTFIGEVVDPEDGLVWRWEREPQPGRQIIV